MATLRVLIVRMWIVAGPISFCAAQGLKAGPEAGSWMILQQGLGQDVPRYEIALSLSETRPSQFGSQQINKVFESLDAPEDGYTHRVDFDPTPEGVRCALLLRPAREIVWLGREDSGGYSLFRVAVLQGRAEEDLKTVKEGYVSMGQSFSVPIEIPGAALGLPGQESVRGSMEFRVDPMGPGTYRVYLTPNVNASLTGSTMTESAKLDVTLECAGAKRLEDRQIVVQVTPFDKRLRPDTASGKISDIISLQTSRLVVEKIAADYSRVGLAVVYGRVGESTPEELADQSRGIAPQRPLPRFARVDLVRRRLVSLDDLCAEAGESGRIVLVFGDHPPEMPGYYEGPRGRSTASLPLEEDLIEKTVRLGVEKPLVLAFVCKRFDATSLYDRWLGKDPNFYMLSDFSQPSYALTYRGPGPYFSRGMPGSGVQVETLRGKFALPEDNVSVLLVDGKGTVLQVEADAQDKLERVLTGINEAIRGLSSTSDPNQAPARAPAPASAPAPAR
jgi:hypothetical protein